MSPTREPASAGAWVPVVGIGASAGGLEALQQFFRTVADDIGLAYVVIVHLAPDRESELASILARETSMPVTQVVDHERAELEADHVYVIAPNRKLEVVDGAVGASRFEEPRGQRSAVDLFFRSLADARGDIFAVILSGGGTDGAVGAKSVKEAGGLVLVQDPREASHNSMPRAAVATGVADLVLPVRELAGRLAELVHNRAHLARLVAPREGEAPIDGDDEAVLRDIIELLRRRTGQDFSNYKRTTVVRRLVRRMQLRHVRSLREYLRDLEGNVEEVQALFNDLLITVTMFFRNPEAWSMLGETVIRKLIEQAAPDGTIRCWVPGCATGEEAYTLAILFGEEMDRQGVQREVIIFASDVDERALGVGRQGVYPASIDADVSDERLQRWFRRTEDHYRVIGELRDRVVFAVHSLQRDPPFSRLHLVSCRNLLIYLDRELQSRVMQILRYAIRDDGYLFLGASETADENLFRLLAKQYRIYAARETPMGRRPTLPDLPSALPALPSRREPERSAAPAEPAGEAHRIALEELSPPSLMVDDRWQILHLSENAGRYLQPRGGPSTHLVTESVRPELRGELALALRQVFEAGEAWLSEFVPVRFNGQARRMAVLAQPRAAAEGEGSLVLVTFLEAGAVSRQAPDTPAGAHSDREQSLLEKLHQAEQYIEQLRAEHHAGEEDLRATNEELQSLNEEYRSTTEELETSKEELQSINEELQTVNNELKNKLEEISRAHSDLENLMAATDIGTLFLDRGLCIKRFTPTLTGNFNLKSHDYGRPIGDITHNLDYQDLEQDARRVLADLAPVERNASSRDGSHFVVRLRPYRTADDRIDGVVMTLVDVTTLKRTEEVLRRSEERFRALVDASAQMVWTTDEHGAVVEDSPSWRGFTGQSREARQGWGWLDAVHPDDRPSVERDWRQCLKRQSSFAGEYRVYHAASGGYRWTSVRAVPLTRSDSAVSGWVAMNTDINERRQSEDALRESDQRKDEFLATLGHELRNPLAAIRISVEVVNAAEQLPADRSLRRAFQIVDRQSQHMARLVDDLLDVTRIARDKLELKREPTDVVCCLEELLDSLRSRIDGAGLQLNLDLPREPVHVDADPNRLVQMLDNLLHNAVAYTDPGGHVGVSIGVAEDQALIAISDSGIGLDPQEIDRLFEPFQQTEHGVRTGGLGLGLALVKRLAELHGGSVNAYSAGRGRGSEFHLALPLAVEQAAPAAGAAAAPAPAPRRVLVVDDEADNADALSLLLQGLGQEVRVAYHGNDALEVASQLLPQVAFLDLSMPDMNGRELARRLREQFPPERLMLVALTGHGRDHALMEEGVFEHHLLKPPGVDRVTNILASAPRRG